MASLVNKLFDNINRELILSKKIESIINNYEYIILDCPPLLDLIAISSLYILDSIIILIIKVAQNKTKANNKTLFIVGILCTMFDNRVKSIWLIINEN